MLAHLQTTGLRDCRWRVGWEARALMSTAAWGQVLSFQRSSVASFQAAHRDDSERTRASGVVNVPRRQLFPSVRGMKGDWNVSPGE